MEEAPFWRSERATPDVNLEFRRVCSSVACGWGEENRVKFFSARHAVVNALNFAGCGD